MPKRSAAQPVSGMTVASARVYAVTVHATVEYGSGFSGLSAKTIWKVGRAMLTTVMSRIDMIAPSTTTPAILSTAASMVAGYSGWAGGPADDVTDDVALGVALVWPRVRLEVWLEQTR